MSIVLSVVLCVVSSVAYAAGALLQRRLAARPLAALLVDPVWWVALLLNGAGALLHVAALRFGPLLLVQPFGLLTLVLVLIFAASGQRRRLQPAEWQGLGLICLSLTGLLVVTDGATTAGVLGPQDMPVLLGAVALVVVVARGTRRRTTAGLGAAVAAGASFAAASALAQTITIELSTAAGSARLAGAALVMAVLAGAGVLLTQLSYRDSFGAAVAASTLANPAASAVIGIVFLGEGVRWGSIGVAIAVGCAVLAVRGVTVLPADTTQDREHDRPPQTTKVRGSRLEYHGCGRPRSRSTTSRRRGEQTLAARVERADASTYSRDAPLEVDRPN